MAMRIEWTCKRCETPNVITCEHGKQYTLSCQKCGAPGQLENVGRRPAQVMDTLSSTCSTSAVIANAGRPRMHKGLGLDDYDY